VGPIVLPQTWRAFIGTAVAERRRVERVYLLHGPGEKRDVGTVAPGRRSSIEGLVEIEIRHLAVLRIHRRLARRLGEALESECLEHLVVEPHRPFVVIRPEGDM